MRFSRVIMIVIFISMRVVIAMQRKTLVEGLLLFVLDHDLDGLKDGFAGAHDHVVFGKAVVQRTSSFDFLDFRKRQNGNHNLACDAVSLSNGRIMFVHPKKEGGKGSRSPEWSDSIPGSGVFDVSKDFIDFIAHFAFELIGPAAIDD